MNMRRSTLSILGAILLCFAAHGASAQAKRIELPQLEAMFAQMRAKAPWNVDGPLLWGYFFLDADPDKLKRVATELVNSGYRVVGISEISGRRMSRLHVEKVEVHSPQTLHERNSQLYALATKYEVASYDGMDVGPAPR